MPIDPSPERFREVRRLFHAALERAEGDRAGFLLAACPDDAELREEVAALLTANREAGSFLEDRGSTRFTPGARLGPLRDRQLRRQRRHG
jgi:hypothetical protein